MTRRYYHPQLPHPGHRVTLHPQVSHHVLRVCRTPRGETILLFNGRGAYRPARLVGVDGDRAVVEGVEDGSPSRLAGDPHHPPNAAPGRLILLQAMCRHAAFDLIVRMATELGVHQIYPLRTRRSVAAGNRQARWQRICTSAASQCGRNDLPTILPPTSLKAALGIPTCLAPAWCCCQAPRGFRISRVIGSCWWGPRVAWTTTRCCSPSSTASNRLACGDGPCAPTRRPVQRWPATARRLRYWMAALASMEIPLLDTPTMD